MRTVQTKKGRRSRVDATAPRFLGVNPNEAWRPRLGEIFMHILGQNRKIVAAGTCKTRRF
jgi:hypothetical protein